MSGLVTAKKDASFRLPVRLTDTGGNPVSGVVFGAVSASYERADGTTATLSVTNPDWVAVTFGVFSGQGNYDLIIPASATSVEGFLRIVVAATGAVTKTYVVDVAAYLPSEIYSAIAALPSSATTAAAVWDVVLATHLTAGTSGRALYYAALMLAQLEAGVKGGPAVIS